MSQFSIASLPVEIWLDISEYFNHQELIRLPLVNNFFWELSKNFSSQHQRILTKAVKKQQISLTKLEAYARLLAHSKDVHPLFEEAAYHILGNYFPDSPILQKAIAVDRLISLKFNLKTGGSADFNTLLSKAARLKKLDLSFEDPSDLNHLADPLTALNSISLKGALWAKLTTLSTLTSIKSAVFEGTHNNAFPLGALHSWQQLCRLNLRQVTIRCPLSDLSSCTSLTKLTLQNVLFNQDSMIKLPSSLQTLSFTDGCFNSLQHTVHLKELTSLRKIELSQFNPSFCLAYLPKNLTCISFRFTSIEKLGDEKERLMKKLPLLAEFTQLKEISMGGLWNDHEIQQIRKTDALMNLHELTMS